jgi:hypothetical protein
VKKFIILLLVFLGAVFCLYAQESGGVPDVYDFDSFYEDPADSPIIGDDGTLDETAEEEPRGFFGTLLSYLDNPKVTSRHLDRKRFFEVELFDVEAKFGNNLFGLGDFFKKEFVIDFNKINNSIGDNGADLNMSLDLSAMRISVNPTQRWGGSFGVKTSERFDLTIPGELIDLIAEGNEGKSENKGEFVISGSAFYEIGFNVHGTLPVLNNKLTIGIDPAFYSPLFYIPRSGISYELNTDDEIKLNMNGKFKAYMPVNTSDMNAGDLFSSGGVDLSLSAEYALFSRLDLGLSLSHIPLIPARLSTGYELTVAPKDGKPIINITDINDEVDTINEMEMTGGGDFIDLPPITVLRPLRFDFYNIYRPFNNDLLSVRPNIGFTALTASEEVYLNMGTRVTLTLDSSWTSRIFAVYLDSGLEEDLWRHKLGFELNLRAFELDFEIGMLSQNYLTSWTGSGLSAKLGIALGW